MWVQLDVWHDVRRLEDAADLFQSRTYPRVRAAFGSEWRPGIDSDPRIHILHVTGLGKDVIAYTSSLDQYPTEMHPSSNAAELIVINVDQVYAGSSTYNAMLARQFQHLVQWNQDRNEERWLKEGLADLAASVSGFDVAQSAQLYAEQPDVSLVHWSGEAGQREALYLFAAYFYEQFGDEGTRILASEPANGIPGVEAALTNLNSQLTFEDFFANWLTANYLDSVTVVEEPHRSYRDLDLPQPKPVAVHEAYPVEVETSVQQFGADYIVLQGDADLKVQFSGQTQTPLLSVSSFSGQRAWWSNRADESLTTLTRQIDLSGVEEASLVYRVWYDMEPHYDYATLSVKARDEENWRTLRTPSGTGANPYGNNPGWGYTGKSDGWIREEVDISDYAGKEISVRFSYLTDGIIVGDGFLLDDLSVPEIGFADDGGGGNNGWQAKGFLPTDGFVSQRYLALLIRRGGETTVERLPLSDHQTAEWTVRMDSAGLREAVLVVSGVAPLTAHPASYRIRITD